MEIIKLEKVNKIYDGSFKVLFDIDLSFEKGSFNSIIGQSGSGKSTLLNIIGTLDKPTDGDIIINNTNTKGMKKDDLASLRNEEIGFIFQFHYLLPQFTALENVLLPYQIKNGKINKEARDRANELLDLVGLSKIKNKLSSKISGGQQQRVAIARALMNNPKIILADEPTGNLDSESTEKIYELLREINLKFKTTFIIITHDRRVAEKADRIIEIVDGKVNLDISK